MFVDRTSEIRALRTLLASRTPQLVRLFGRRRVGKTELLRRVILAEGGVLLTADDADRRWQLASMSDQIGRQEHTIRRPYRDWDAFFDHVEEIRPRVLVWDEFQRILTSDPQAVTRLQARWDAKWRTEGPHVILSGSSVGMMGRLAESSRGPLYGRLTGSLRLEPFEYPAVRRLYPDLPEEERIRRYAVFGGTPFYHTLSQSLPLGAAVRRALLDPTAPLAEEPQELLRLEMRAPARPNSILYEIGQGTHLLADLEARVGVPKGGLAPYLEELRDGLDLVEMETPVGGVRRPARYVFRDPFFEFYYRFVFPHRSELQLGRAEAVWKQIEGELDAHVGRVFERVVRSVLRAANGGEIAGHPIDALEMGRWWNRTGAEIDLILRGSREIWAGEVKWSRRPFGSTDVHRLLGKLALLERTQYLPVRPFVVGRRPVTRAAAAELTRAGGFALDLAALSEWLDRHSP